jgi:outer membrane protein assembly factor BamB
MVYVRDWSNYMLAFDLATGERVWKSPQLVVNPGRDAYGEGNNSICYGDGLLFYHTYRTIGCINANDGSIRWWLDEIGRQSNKKYSPVVYKGVLYGCYVDPDRTKTVYFARNIDDGSVVWEYVLNDYNWAGTAVSPSAPAIDTVNNILFGSTCKKSDEMGYPIFGKTFALDISTGTTIWENDSIFVDYRNYNSLSYHRGRLYVVSLNYGCGTDTNGVNFRCDMTSILDATTGEVIARPGEHDIAGVGTRSIALHDTVLVTGRSYNERFWICNLMGKAINNTERAAGYLTHEGSNSGCCTPVIANGYVFKANGAWYNGQIAAVKISDVLTKGERDTMVTWAHYVGGSCNPGIVGDGYLAFDNKCGLLNVFTNKTRLTGTTRKNGTYKEERELKLSVSPNPFNPTTILSFTLSSKERAAINIYNSNGKLVNALFSGSLESGSHKIKLCSKERVTGVYVAKLTTNSKIAVAKIVVSK